METNTRPSDLVRQIVVIVAVVLMIVAAMVGVGLFGGTNVRDLHGGALDADATVLAPARPAFAIWSLIYLLTVLYAVWQALPSQRARVRQRSVGWWVAATAVLNGAWLLAAQFLDLFATVLGIVLLVAALAVTMRRLLVIPGVKAADVFLLDAAVGLHLGWVTLATVANITAWLKVVGPDSWSQYATPIGVVVLCLVGVLGIGIAGATRGRLAPALAMAWGLFWIGVARTAGEPASTAVAVTAWIVAVVIVAVAFVMTVFRSRTAPD